MKLIKVLLICCLIFGIADLNADRKLSRMEIYPSTVTMEANDTVVFTALVFSHSGNAHTPQGMQWYATSGVIDLSGRYTAPAMGGTYTITVMYANLRATAQVAVKAFAPAISRIEVSPRSVQLNIGQTYNFSARAYDTYNRPVVFSPTWETTGGGTIDPSSGYFYARTHGTFTVTARDYTSGCYGSATVVIGTPTPMIRLEIFPPTSQVRALQTCQFTAKAYDQYGRPVSISPQWGGTGGSMNTYTGVYTAGAYPGFYQVWVKDINTGAQATAQVEVTKGGGHNPHPQPNPGKARIEIIKKDIGGGNEFRPKAKLQIKVHGKNVQSIKMFALDYAGYDIAELKSASCTDGTEVYFDPRYDRYSTRWLEIRVYDNVGEVVALERLAAK